MAITSVNGVRLFSETTGDRRTPIVLVHGSWTSHHSWDLVVPGLAEAFRVVTYDRRGHSESERPAGQGSVHEDVTDLAELIEQLGLGPAFVAGSSFGAAITLRMAAARPDLIRGVIVHEPPLFGLLFNDPASAPILEEIGRRIGAVVQRIAGGDHAGAAELFAETVALGPGSWLQLPGDMKQTMIENAPTFLDEIDDPDALHIDLSALGELDRPVLLTTGTDSPATFAHVIRKLADAMPRVEVVAFEGAGHAPQLTHPALYVEAITAFAHRHLAGVSPELLS